MVPYLLAMHGWASVVGTSEFALRLPSVLAVAAAAGMGAALNRRLLGARAGLITGMLFAVVPAVSRYGQNAGPQALVIAAAVLATLALVWQLDGASRTKRAGHWLAYAAALIAVGLLDPVALALLVVAHGATVFFMRPRIAVAWFAAALVGALPAGWLLYLSATSWTGRAGAPAAAPHSIDAALGVLFGSALVGGLVIGLGMLGVSLRRPAVVCTAGAIVPIVGILIWQRFAGTGLSPTVFITLGPWTAVAAGQLSRYPVTRGFVAIGVIALLGLPTQIMSREIDGHDQATRLVASTIAERYEPGDAAVYGPTDAAGQTARDLVQRYVPATKEPIDILATAAPRTGGHLYAPECADVAKCLGDAPRVWVIRMDGDRNPLDGMSAGKDGALRVDYVALSAWNFRGVTLTLFVRSTPAATR
jgi:mannosyltransferase